MIRLSARTASICWRLTGRLPGEGGSWGGIGTGCQVAAAGSSRGAGGGSKVKVESPFKGCSRVCVASKPQSAAVHEVNLGDRIRIALTNLISRGKCRRRGGRGCGMRNRAPRGSSGGLDGG